MFEAHKAGSSHHFWILSAFLVFSIILPGTFTARANTTDDEIAALKAQRNDAIFKVQDIVNQPITHLKRTPDMEDVANYPDGWFHPGAITPDFNTVDVRTSQQFPYTDHQYATSPANPGEVFLGSELEFNAMTKYFYTDRSLPKKKLTETEMEEINQLYRIIGQCNDKLLDLTNPDPLTIRLEKWFIAHKPADVAMAAGLLVLLVLIRKLRKPQLET
jgi:hypothetical protein